MRTSTQMLADLLLRQPVEDWVRERRQTKKSWRRISLELRDATKGKVEVSERTIVAWMEAADDTRASSAAS